MSQVSLKEAIRFHGHLGPYLVLGLLAGEFALKRLGCKKYFGLTVRVSGANKKPKSCLIDGLQLSCGATYGKGNIKRIAGSKIEIIFKDKITKRTVYLELKDALLKVLASLISHKDSELLAKKIYRLNPGKLFNLHTIY